MIRIHTIVPASCIALLLAVSGIVAAQETAIVSAPTEMTTTTAPTTVSELSDETIYYGNVAGDCAMRIASTEYVDGTAVLVLESDLPRTVVMTAPTGSTSTGAAAGNLARRPIPPGRTTIRADSPEPRVTLVTLYFVENGRYIETRFDGGGLALIADPLIGMDVQDAAIGGVLGTSFGALLIIVRRRFGLHRDMERVV